MANAKPRAETVSAVDVRLSVLATMLEPACTLARILGLSLDDLQELVSTGYFREYQNRGYSLRMMTRRIGKSLRSVATLSKRAGEAGPPLEGSEKVGFRRLATAAVARRSPVSMEELGREVRAASAEELQEAVALLVEQGILLWDGETLTSGANHLDLVRDDFDHRLASLRHMLTAVTHTVYQRFYTPAADGQALARVLTFDARPGALEELGAQVYASVREAVIAEDEAASGDDARVSASVTLTLTAAPTDAPWLPRKG